MIVDIRTSIHLTRNPKRKCDERKKDLEADMWKRGWQENGGKKSGKLPKGQSEIISPRVPEATDRYPQAYKRGGGSGGVFYPRPN